MKKILCMMTLVWLIAFGLSAQQSSYKVYGYVRDAHGNLLENATVYFVDYQRSILTDSTGYYEAEVSSDTLRLRFSLVGFYTDNQVIYNVPPRPRRRIDSLLEEDIQELEGLTVLGASLENPSLQRVDVAQVRVMPTGTGNSIESLLKTFNGVSSNNELSSQYSVRGGSYDENSVYVNGIEVYRPYLVRTGEQEGLSFVNPDMAGNVQFSAGGFDARYGDKLSSVLDITYRRPLPFEAGVSGSFMGATAYIGSASDKFTQLHGFRYKNASMLLNTLETDAEYDPNFIDYQTCMSYQPVKPLKLSVLAAFSQNSYRFIPQTRTTTFGPLGMMQNFKVYFDGQEKDLFRTLTAAFTMEYKPSDKVDLKLMYSSFFTDERVAYDIAGEYWLSSISSMLEDEGTLTGVGNYYSHARDQMRATVHKVGHDGTWRITKHNRVHWGISYEYELVKERVNEWEMHDSSGYSLPYSPDRVNMYYSLSSDNVLQSSRVRMYVQDNYQLELDNGGTFYFAAGLRGNWWNFNREFTISPRVNITFKPAIKTDMRFHVAAGLYYQSPSFKEIKQEVLADGYYTNQLNPTLRSQRSAQVIVGMDCFWHFLRRPFRFTLDGYYKHLNDVVPYTVDNLTIKYAGENSARGYATGFDMKLFGEFVEGIDSWISFSMVRSKEICDNDGYGYQLRPMDQLYNVSVFFQDYIPRLPQYRVHVLFNWAQGRPTGFSRGTRDKLTCFRIPDYRRVDIGFSRSFEKGKDPWMGRGFFRPFRKILISFEVLNIFGFNNVNSYYWVQDFTNSQYGVPNYLSGRQFNLKLQLDF